MTNKVFHLKENKTFCMLGFMHSHTWPDGRVLPCCAGDINADTKLGNIYEVLDFSKDIWNGAEYQQLRLNMLRGEKNALCKYCYDTEDLRGSSMRTNMNETFAHLYDNIMATVDDASGYCGSDKMYYMDFRFSNLCNQACITCGHDLSSSWYELQSDMYPEHKPERPKFLVATKRHINPYDKIIDNSIDDVEVIYFAGGEPLLVPEHWQILERLVANGRAKHVSLRYSTNLSTLKYKGKHVLDYWNKFGSVTVSASVDEVGDRFNYIRWPGDWSKISANIKTIHDAWCNPYPSHTHQITFGPVISLMNAHRLKDMVECWKNEGLLEASYSSMTLENGLMDNILRGPAQFYLGNAPEWWWEEKLLPSLDYFERWYRDHMTRHKKPNFKSTNIDDLITRGLNGIKATRELQVNSVTSATGRPGKFDKKHWIDWIGRADRARKTDWSTTFPELAWMLNEDWDKRA